MKFERFIAIDWSGAKRGYKGIAVAICEAGNKAPVLIGPPKARWTRSDVADWLSAEAETGSRTLVGFDFAFSMPYEAVGYLDGAAGTLESAYALWDCLENAACGAPDFGCIPIVRDRRFSRLYWTNGRTPKRWILRQRRTEIECAEATSTRPETVFKLIGSKQVGKASLTGMRVLRHVRSNACGRVGIWPFEDTADKKLIMVEIYPTLFRKRAAHGLSKMRTAGALNAALRVLNSREFASKGRITDDETDALISAAGMRYFTHQGLFQLRHIKDEQVRREGWIFGIPLPQTSTEAA